MEKLIITTAFVAIPVPGTGVYTGSVLAIFIGLNFYQTVLSVTVGNIIAGLIVTLICSTFPEFTTIIFIAFLAMLIVYLAYRIVVAIKAKQCDGKN